MIDPYSKAFIYHVGWVQPQSIRMYMYEEHHHFSLLLFLCDTIIMPSQCKY